MTNLVMACSVSQLRRAASGSTQSDGNLLAIGDSMVRLRLTAVSGHTRAFIKLLTNFFMIILFLNVVITVLDKWCVAVLNSFIDSVLIKNYVAILGINFFTNLLTEGFELCDICEMTNVDGAMRATQKFFSLQALDRFFRIDTLHACFFIQYCCAKVQ